MLRRHVVSFLILQVISVTKTCFDELIVMCGMLLSAVSIDTLLK